MNKKVLGVVAFMLFSFYGNAQTITKLNAEGYYTDISPDGNTVVFSEQSYDGLKKINLDTKEIEVLSKETKAGYSVVVNNNQVLYKTIKSEVNILNINTKVLKKVSALSTVSANYNQGTFGKKNLNIPVEAVSSKDLYSVNIVYADGVVNKIANKVGENKIWVSLSPDKSKVLYTVVGQQTFITDLSGKVISTIKRAEAPKWANNNTIVFMITAENRDDFTEGNIYKYTVGDKEEVLLTNNFNKIAMYPVMSANEAKVVFNTVDGEIYLIETTK
ncbi:MAG: hypothetical protein KAG96_03500 [Ichthyobacteriaceae bacterium]|nr:hypothetical protein [Ichthyobacteriaceae bacterium]